MPVAPSLPSWDNQKHFCKCPQGANSPAAENLWSAHIFFVSFASQPGAVGAGVTDTGAEEFGGLTTERPVAGPGSEASAPTGGPLTPKQKPVIQEASDPLGQPGHHLTFSFFGLSLKTSSCCPLGESSQCCRIFWPAYPSCHPPPPKQIPIILFIFQCSQDKGNKHSEEAQTVFVPCCCFHVTGSCLGRSHWGP